MSNEKEVKNLIDPEALPIVSSGTPTVQHKEDFETIAHNAGVGIGGDDLYERYGKLVYLFDNSGSMDSRMPMSDSPSLYEWDAELLKKFRKAMQEYLEAQKDCDVDEGEEDEFDDVLDAEPLFDSIPFDDEELKRLIVDADLADEFKIKLPKTYNPYGSSGKSKIQAVKDAARGFVENRFEKYPDANVMVFGFAESASVFARGAGKEEVLNGVESLDAQGGNTRIFTAMRTVIGEFKKRPSQVRCHHVVLVTDGFDNDSDLMTGHLSNLQELGIVVDFIFVKGHDDSQDDNRLYKEKIDAIRLVCEKTGGEYTEVNTVDDFETKFLAVSNRPMLPWKG